MTNKDLIVNSNPKSIFSESIKTIRTNLQFSSIDHTLKTILITSPEPGDGKSFLAANLAIAYSQENRRVLIIDCDLRKGRQHLIFQKDNVSNKGYSNLILNYNMLDLSSYLLKTDIKNVDLLPTGPTPPNPIELLSSKNNEYLLNKLKGMYDVIILDCPPVLGISDTIVMTHYTDASLLVVSSKQSKMELLGQAKKSFEKANAKITGVVINKANVKDYSYHGYYCNSYYGEK